MRRSMTRSEDGDVRVLPSFIGKGLGPFASLERGVALDWLDLRISRHARLAPEQQRRNHAHQRDTCRNEE